MELLGQKLRLLLFQFPYFNRQAFARAGKYANLRKRMSPPIGIFHPGAGGERKRGLKAGAMISGPAVCSPEPCRLTVVL